jgi:hypothetical protein
LTDPYLDAVNWFREEISDQEAMLEAIGQMELLDKQRNSAEANKKANEQAL